MAVHFDAPQLEAINSRQGNFLVSAGAGSGKTAVLTERIKSLILDGSASLDQLLVLTFTNKAAAEMKSRTREKLLEAYQNKEIPNDLSSEVECADITTFDAFFLKLVKKYAFRLEIDPDVTIADESILQIKQRELIDEALSDRYKGSDPVFKELVSKYTMKDDDKLVTYIKGILHLCELAPNANELFDELKEKIFTDAYLNAAEQEHYKKLNDDILAAFFLLEGDSQLVFKDNRYVSSWLGLGSYSALYERLQLELLSKAKGNKTVCIKGEEFPLGFGSKSKKDPLTETENLKRDIAKELFKGVINSLSSNGDSASQRAKILETKKYVSILVDIAKEVYEKMAIFKKEKNAYGFSDIAALAMKLLEEEDILKEIKDKYKFIMVDEYQDSSDIQESFISKISHDNVFMVGDIKQSIYRFRNANPDIFAEKLSKYGVEEGGHAIYLQKNFRSRLEVIDFVNDLFGKIMSPEVGEVDYMDGQALEFGNKALYGETPNDRFKATILSYELEEDLEKAELEARAIANDIIDKVQNGFEVTVKNQGNRPCDWGDFAILMPTKSQFNTYKKVFGEAKIPLVATIGNELDDDSINMVFLRLLKLPLVIGIDETATKHCYASVKRSYLFEEDDDKLIEELQSGAYEEDNLIKTMSSEKDKLLSMGVHEAVSYLFEKYGFVEKLKRIGNVKANFKTITSFLEEAESAERMGMDYRGYVEYFENLKKYDIKQEIKGDFAGDNVVKLMTIHASKGLEFPIVYCPNNLRKYNKGDASGFYLYSRKYGLLLPKTRSDDYSGNYLQSLFKEEETRKALSEYMRLFYVQLTRASNQLIFLSPKGSGDIYKMIEVPTVGRKILTKEKTDKDGKVTNVSVQLRNFTQFLFSAGKDAMDLLFAHEDANTDKPVPFARMRQLSPFQEPKLRTIDSPAQEIQDKRASKTSIAPINEAAAQYGTHMHRLLELVSFKKKDASFITNDSERKKIEALFNHDIFDNLDGYREFHEYRYIDDENNLEGSIDLLLVKAGEKAIIVDYKTKNIDDEAYDKQLGLYKQYVEKVFGLKAETYLLSISDNVLKVVE